MDRRIAKVDSYLVSWGRRRARLWVAFVLPGLLLRALIPVGFMPMFGPNFGVRITLCEGYAPVPSMPMDMSMDMPMDMPMSVPAQHHSPGDPRVPVRTGLAPTKTTALAPTAPAPLSRH